MTLLSIVTVNLDDARGLRATAESVAAQRFADREWLVIDGGSSDGSLGVIEEFAALIDGWSSAPDRGVYDGMNQGLRRARGRYVIFMNGGDRFAGPNTLAEIAAALTSAPAVDLLLGGTILALPSGAQVYRPPRPAHRVRFGPPAYHQATVFRRRAHLLAPYDLALRVSADYGAIATLISRGARCRCLDRPLAIRQCGPGSLSERETATRFADFVRVQRRVLARGWPAVAIAGSRLALVHLAYRLAAKALPKFNWIESLHDLNSEYDTCT